MALKRKPVLQETAEPFRSYPHPILGADASMQFEIPDPQLEDPLWPELTWRMFQDHLLRLSLTGSHRALIGHLATEARCAWPAMDELKRMRELTALSAIAIAPNSMPPRPPRPAIELYRRRVMP